MLKSCVELTHFHRIPLKDISHVIPLYRETTKCITMYILGKWLLHSELAWALGMQIRQIYVGYN